MSGLRVKRERARGDRLVCVRRGDTNYHHTINVTARAAEYPQKSKWVGRVATAARKPSIERRREQKTLRASGNTHDAIPNRFGFSPDPHQSS